MLNNVRIPIRELGNSRRDLTAYGNEQIRVPFRRLKSGDRTRFDLSSKASSTVDAELADECGLVRRNVFAGGLTENF